MLAKLIVEGKEFDIEILDPKLRELIAPTKNTGYERVDYDEKCFVISYLGGIIECIEDKKNTFETLYDSGNYYSNKTVAENNARADKLMRQLRRFTVEHRENNNPNERYYIYYLRDSNLLQLRRDTANSFIGPWFDSQHAGVQAIETFGDELIWYFTEYKDSL